MKNNIDTEESSRIAVLAFYKFSNLHAMDELHSYLLDFCRERGIKGTILLAPEGINGTVAGKQGAIEALIAEFDSIDGLPGMERKISFADEPPFHRLKVKIKKEIVTMGVPGIDVANRTGVHLDAKEWNQLIENEDVLVLDTRNQYEIDIGTFKNAISPCTDTFREFPGYVEQALGADRKKKIAMFCTGGIRCEKASAYLVEQGFDEVYQLNGGILRYLEEVEPKENLWRGECFVFDSRVSVDANLDPGSYKQCFACRHPLSEEQLESDKYREGVSCPMCFDSLDEKKRASVEERQKQVALAEARNQQHIGAIMPGSSGMKKG